MNWKKGMIEVVSYLFIMLFGYTAFSKLLDLEDFKVQVGQSPLVTAFQTWLPFVVIAVELIVALMLLFPRYRALSLMCSYFLMTSFTAYVAAILKFSPYLPCSCGGVLQTMNWTEHLIFNGSFMVLALVAFFFEVSERDIRAEKQTVAIV